MTLPAPDRHDPTRDIRAADSRLVVLWQRLDDERDRLSALVRSIAQEVRADDFPLIPDDDDDPASS